MLQTSILGRHLLLYIISFSFFITLMTSMAILYFDYKTEIKAIGSSISRIEAAYIPSISSSLWNYDHDQLLLQLEGISNFPGVIACKILDEKSRLIKSHGVVTDEEAIQYFELPLTYNNGDKEGDAPLGHLVVAISKEEIYANLINKAIVILSSQFFKTITVSLFILFLVYQMITRHLIKISRWAKDVKIESFDKELLLDRPARKYDELSIVTGAFNTLRLNVRKYHQQMNDTQAALETLNIELEDRVNNRTRELKDTITELETIRNKIELINKNTQDSIKYASLIQNSIIPTKEDYQNFFEESFVFWKPKNIVGGDIYLFDVLENNNECVSMVIDCTGHGVPGAFVTMLVKAIERQIINNISSRTEQVDVSNILSSFNKELKKILKQEGHSKALSNVGFDGAIIYYNKNDKVIKYAGGNTPLFYMKDDKLNIIKGDKQSIGYKGSDSSYQFNQHVIDVEKGMIFYLTSDGYLDQNGGSKLFPFGKSRFKNIIKENYKKPLSQQREIFVGELERYKSREEQTDDITLVALKI